MLKYLRESALTEFRDSIGYNLESYISGNFEEFFDYEDFARELKGDFDLDKLKNLKKPKDKKNLYDAENSKLVFETLKNLTPLQAREERFWAFLCHFDCLGYVRERWPIPDKSSEKQIKHIQTHFFAASSRGLERDNAISRLWWMGYIASQAKGIELEEALAVFLHETDVRANVIERPTTSTSANVFSAILQVLKTSYNGKKLLHNRANFRPFMKEINRIGGRAPFKLF